MGKNCWVRHAPAECVAVSKHLFYEMRMVLATARRMAEHALLNCVGEKAYEQIPEGNSLLESFAIHARLMYHFFYHDPAKARSDDALAADFALKWGQHALKVPTALAPIAVSDRADGEVAHLTFRRNEPSASAEWKYMEVALAIDAVFQIFLQSAEAQRLDRVERAKYDMERASFVAIQRSHFGSVTTESSCTAVGAVCFTAKSG